MGRTNLIIVIVFSLCSCVSTAPVRENRPYAWLSDTSKFFLLPPDDIEISMDMAQQISASYGGADYVLNAWVKADETGLDMTLLNELGANMGELSFRSGAVSFSSPLFPKSLEPAYIVADFQLCFYNEISLRRALESCGLEFETTQTGRLISSNGKIIIEIEKKSDSVSLINHLRGYTYTLEGEFY